MGTITLLQEILNIRTIYSRRTKKEGQKSFLTLKMYIYIKYYECKLREHSKKYIFKLNIGVFIKTKYYVSSLRTDKATLLEVRAPLKFKDILVSNNKHKFL